MTQILTYPDKRLRKVAEPLLTEWNDTQTDVLQQWVEQMAEAMYEEPGIGLAAPQIGIDARLIVIDTNWTESGERKPLAVVNPEIQDFGGHILSTEGCLSVPGITVEVERSSWVKVVGLDLEGNPYEEAVVDHLRSACFQHEIDHLNGILLIDHLSNLKRDIYDRKLRKARKIAKRMHK